VDNGTHEGKDAEDRDRNEGRGLRELARAEDEEVRAEHGAGEPNAAAKVAV